MTTFQLLSILGVGTVLAAIYGHVFKLTKKTARSVKAICLGLQAVLRAQMIDDYNYYSAKGYAPIYAKQNFENCWIQYEALGANGVMEGIRHQFMELPDSKPKTKEEHSK